MFRIADGRNVVYQWDINVKLLLDDADESVDEVHFSSRFSRTSISVEVVRVDGQPYIMIPNILLQKHADIIAYFYVSNADGSYTKYDTTIPVTPRPKPSDYVYEEIEILTWNTLDKKIDNLRDNMGTVKTVNGTAPDESGNINVKTGDVLTDEEYETLFNSLQ